MKKLYIYSVISALLLSIVGCTLKEETQIPVPTHRASFRAIMEGGGTTKALLGDSAEDGYRELLWEPQDSIKILCRPLDYVASYTGHTFVNIGTSNSTEAIFEGDMHRSYDLLAIYPHNIYTNGAPQYGGEGNDFYRTTICIPSVQTYRENNISKEAVPMAAYKSLDSTNYLLQGEMEFRNLCGVLVLNLTGEDKVRSITITAKDTLGNVAPLSGFADIKRTAEEFHILKMHNVTKDGMAESGVSYVTLNCPDVQLTSDKATPFHIALPPGKYNSFQLTIATADGEIMFLEAEKPLVINRSKIKNTVPLTYTETIPVNISERGTSNCYVVSEAGIYKFNGNIIGNGEAGIYSDAAVHTSNAAIAPDTVEILWDNGSGVISSITYNSETGFVTFMASGQEGNALVAAKDEEGTILWSWHIWCTDKPEDHNYVNEYGLFTVMDRNLGATRADRGTNEEWRESIGTLYQWGRKDPMLIGYTSTTNTRFSIKESITYPTLHASCHDYAINVENVSTLWSPERKTIYDPCPVGYRVAPIETFKGFTTDGQPADRIENYVVEGTFDYGWNFKYDGTKTAWYPVTSAYIYTGGWNVGGNNQGIVRSATTNMLYFIYNTDLDNRINFSSECYVGDALPVRCIKDDGYVDISLPTVTTSYASNIITDGATLKGNVTAAGQSDVVSRGFVWSTEHRPTIELETKVEVEGLSGEYEYKLTGLNSFTTYYVRAYATNGHGTAYGKEVSFTTLYTGAIENLSIHGTSNCYVVEPEAAHYSIDASVIGNGIAGILDNKNFHTNNPFITPSSMKIVWQDSGHPIDFADYHNEGKYIHFHTTGAEGNAVVAALDTDGNVLWSWHIWCTDKPAEHIYSTGYTVMDRNLGATRADRGTGEEWKESCGIEYQWGRKDPFAPYKFTESSVGSGDVATSISNPRIYLTNWDRPEGLWSDTTKTIYDPCPVGYMIPHANVWSGFSTDNVVGTFDNGYNFIYDDSDNSAWYPNKARGYENSVSYWSDAYMYHSNRNQRFYFYNGYVTTSSWDNSNDRHQVRCVKNRNYVDAAIPTIAIEGIENITTTSAEVKCMVSKAGGAEITSRGILFGTTPDLTLENTTPITSEGGTGEFTITLSGLDDASKYYVRGFATNEYGTSYTKVINFTTEYGGSHINLSTFETANSYIVSTANTEYCFNASVKGNSNTSVGNAASAEVIWQTKNTSESVTECEIIKEVALDGIFVTFSLPETPVSGNALIAVKDSDGNILWSWHIWVTDYNPKSSAHTYKSGAVMMDRNLGALNANIGDVKSFGMLYQWGRKDPFTSVGETSNGNWATTYPDNGIDGVDANNDSNYNTQDYAVKHPNTIIFNSNWNYNYTLWGAKKSMNDPCPPGWKVPDGSPETGVWSGWNNENSRSVDYGTVRQYPHSIPEAYYPVPGVRQNSSSATNLGYEAAYFGNSSHSWDAGHAIQFWYSNINEYNKYWFKNQLASVRCQNIEMERFIINDATVEYSNTHKRATVSTTVTVTESGKSYEKGYVWSMTSSVPVIGNGTQVTVSGDEFSVTIDELKPTTTYFIIPYIICDGVTKYGRIVKFMTDAQGNGNEVTEDEDEYEW